jgi:hypothetical protein
VTTPRYPTSAKYRRHRSKSYLWPVFMGLLFGGGIFLLAQLFSDDDSSVEVDAIQEDTESLEVLEDVMPDGDESSSSQKFVPLTSPAELEPQPKPRSESLKPVVKKRQAEKITKPLQVQPLPSSTPLKSTDEEQELRSSNMSVPSLPSGLRPKAKDPDVQITFYKEFSRRKVVVPKQEKGVALDGSTAFIQDFVETSKINAPRPLPPKPGDGLLGVYRVQLGIFSSLDRANAVIRELKKKRAPAYLLKVDGAKAVFYRVRLGPFSSQVEAKWAMNRWKLRGSSPLILRQRP